MPAYRSLAAPSRAELRVKGSRFIACAFPVSDVPSARERMATLRCEHPDATHHCYAYRIAGVPADLERSSDAGEPAGTAGQPIRRSIDAAGLKDVLVVVVRYFGGTRLGKGGLARAYRDAAKGALAVAPRVERRAQIDCELRGPTERDGEVRHLIAQHGGEVLRADYDGVGGARLLARLPVEAAGRVEEDLKTLTRGGWSAESAVGAGPEGEEGR